MAVAEASHEPASKKRKQKTTKTTSTKFWDAGFAWRGTRLAKPAQHTCPLCSSRRSLLIQPACDPDTQKGVILTNPRLIIRRSLSEASSAVMNGCIICELVIAAQTTISQHTTLVDRLDGFMLALCWFDGSSRFGRIDVLPVDYMNRYFSPQGPLNAIRLVSEDGIVLKLYSRILVKLMACRARGQSNQLSKSIAYRFGTV